MDGVVLIRLERQRLDAPSVRWGLALWLVTFAAWTWGAAPNETMLDGELASHDAAFEQQLEEVAARCDSLGLDEQSGITRRWRGNRDPRRQYFYLPHQGAEFSPLATDRSEVASWKRRMQKLRTARGETLFELAQRYALAGSGAPAYQLLHEVLREDPDHREARRILSLGDSKATEFNRRPRAVVGPVPHATLGWRRGGYWTVESRHYRVVTNQSAQAALELDRLLEDFAAVWRQAFFGYWGSSDSLVRRFEGQEVPLGKTRRHEVVLFKDRDEYVTTLSRAEPQIAISLGYYSNERKTAYFYAGDPSLRSTWIHEATHQLFQELGDTVPQPGLKQNFWIVEGIAQYVESFEKRDFHWTLGGVDADRLQFSRARTLTGEFFQPFAEMVGLGRDALQKDERIRRIYSQAAGVAHCLMDADNGRYRESTLEYLKAVYAGRDQPESLAALTGETLESLEAAYRQFLLVSDDDLSHLPPLTGRRNLSLGRTGVTERGLKELDDPSQMEWLDLSFLDVSDAGLAPFMGVPKLRQLNLERTRITDTTLEALGKLRQLEELDLSSTAITDAGLRSLSSLTNLKVLWLTNTAVTDAGLSALEPLRKLEVLDLEGTQVTAEAQARLRKRLPALSRANESAP